MGSGYEQGLAEGAKIVSTLGIMTAIFSVFNLVVLGDDSFVAGSMMAVALQVISEASARFNKPEMLFLHEPVAGDGACLFHAAPVSIGSNSWPFRLRAIVIQYLSSNWNQPCPAAVARRIPAAGTVGEALCAEHGRKFKDGADYAKYMLKRDKHGGWQWSTSVEVCALATIMCSIVIVWTRTPDGSLALRDLYYPDNAPNSGRYINLLHGSQDCGGCHFDALVPLDFLPHDRAAFGRREAIGVSASAWREACLEAAAAALVFVYGKGDAARRDAELAVGGVAALGALARECAELEVERSMVSHGVEHEVVRDASVGLVAQEAGPAPWDAVAFLADHGRLLRAVATFVGPLSATTPQAMNSGLAGKERGRAAMAGSDIIVADEVPCLIEDSDDEDETEGSSPMRLGEARTADDQVQLTLSPFPLRPQT